MPADKASCRNRDRLERAWAHWTLGLPSRHVSDHARHGRGAIGGRSRASFHGAGAAPCDSARGSSAAPRARRGCAVSLRIAWASTTVRDRPSCDLESWTGTHPGTIVHDIAQASVAETMKAGRRDESLSWTDVAVVMRTNSVSLNSISVLPSEASAVALPRKISGIVVLRQSSPVSMSLVHLEAHDLSSCLICRT
ncbi:hypothetical protein PYCCODRAFT_651071 [Trametes coccinea BRFM310]|uniref:Uncharacterized protein n=1 Tax=Trametes coccinea (strain BRFM310) TaxID=1353009 RepID=A0A1Y2IIK6_TRAC3|nr:hypothetical protein PYCCODRAFT_651071 [Trametes coccinea BRFM310]